MAQKKTKARFKTNYICLIFLCYFFSLQTDCLMSLIPQRQIKGEGQEAFAKKQWISLKNMTSQILKSRARCQTKADVVSRVRLRGLLKILNFPAKKLRNIRVLEVRMRQFFSSHLLENSVEMSWVFPAAKIGAQNTHAPILFSQYFTLDAFLYYHHY